MLQIIVLLLAIFVAVMMLMFIANKLFSLDNLKKSAIYVASGSVLCGLMSVAYIHYFRLYEQGDYEDLFEYFVGAFALAICASIALVVLRYFKHSAKNHFKTLS